MKSIPKILAAAAAALALVLGTALPAAAGYATCTSTQTVFARTSVTASAPSNAPSQHYYYVGGKVVNFVGLALYTSTNAGHTGSQGWSTTSPYAFSVNTGGCTANPV